MNKEAWQPCQIDEYFDQCGGNCIGRLFRFVEWFRKMEEKENGQKRADEGPQQGYIEENG